MANKERENFYRGSTLILDNTKTSFVDLLELHLKLKNISFENFIDLHQHEIYHLSYGTRGTCCQCTTGYVLPPKRVLYLVQLEIIFDQYKKKHCHHSGTKGDYCCAEPKSGIKTDTLDITLIRVLLVNFCQDVFWYSCLDLPSQSFEDFLNKNKHHIYHLRERNMQCCKCPLGYIFPKTDRLQSLGLDEWRLMFNLPVLPCPLHRISPSDLICTVSAPRGIDVSDLDYNLTKLILEQCCPLRKAIDILIGIRNTYIGHASVGRISDANFEVFKSNIESGIMEIARVCENEVLTKQSLSDVCKRPLDETLCIQYQNMLLENIVKENRLEEKIDDIAVKIPDQIEQAVNNVFNTTIPNMMEQSVQSAIQKIYEPNTNLTIDQQRRKRKLLEDNLSRIKWHSSEDTFVETDVISIALNELENTGALVLTGTAGAGKSRSSLEIIRRFAHDHDVYCGIKLNNISEWIEILEDKDCLIVLLDDVFGRTNCIFNAEDEKFFDNIHSTIVQGFVKVIFTMRNTIRSDQQVSDIIDRQRIFQKSRFIDLSSTQIEMKENQKRECLLKYCKLNNILISDTHQYYDDKRVIDPLVPLFLSKQDVHEISNIDISPLMGYPQSCFLFTSNRKFTRLGVAFFKHPTKSLCMEIDSLRKSGNINDEEKLQYAILVYMALNEDLLDLHEIKMNKFNKVLELLYHKKEFTAQNIRQGLGQLTMRYIRTNPNGTYSFQHRSIFESVLLSYNDIKTESLIPLLHIDFILEMGRLDGYITQSGLENEITLVFRKEDFKLLAHKIIAELRKNDSPQNFMERLCSSRILRNADGYFLEELFKEYMLTKCEMFCRLRHLDSEKESKRFHEKYIDSERAYIISKRTSVTFLTFLLKFSIKYADNTTTICHILKLMEQDLHVHKKNYINNTHEKCFTEAILQSCAYLDNNRLNIIWKFVEKNRISLDKTSFSSYNFGLNGLNGERKIAALKLLARTVLTSGLIDSKYILAKAIEANDTSLVELIFEQASSEIDVNVALYYACAAGAVPIVQWFFSKIPQEELNIEKAFLVSCSKGSTEYPIASSTFQDACLKDTGKVVLFLLKNFRTDIINFTTAMHNAVLWSQFNTCKLLMENTDNYFNAEAVLLGIAKYTKYEYESTHACFAFVKDFVTEYLCLNADVVHVVLTIAEKHNTNFDMVRWIMSIAPNEIFYKAWNKHKWVHKKICALELIYDTEFYKTLELTKLIDEELEYGNNDCLRFLIEKIDKEKALKVIVEKVCACGDENLMHMLFEKFSSLNIEDAINIALKKRNWEAIQWICKNFNIEKLNFEAIMETIMSCGSIHVIRYFTEIIDRKYFDSRNILLVIQRGVSFMDENDRAHLIKFYLQDTKNIYRINEMLKLSCMKVKKYTEVIFKTLFQNCNIEFLHLNIALRTLLMSRDFDSLKILLYTFDTTIFDMNIVIEGIWDIFRYRGHGHAESITKWLLQNFDPILFDISFILKMTCCADKLEFAQWLCRQFKFSNLTLESVFIYACKFDAISVLPWLFKTISFQISFKKVIKELLFNMSMSVVIFLIQNFDLDRADIDNLCRIYSREEVDQLEFQLCIFEAYGSTLVDVKSVFDSVCRLSSIEEVKWFMRIVDNNLLNFFSAIKEALRGNNDETFLFLFEFLKLIDIKEANEIFIKASCHGNLEAVKILHDKYGESLRISVAMKELCENEGIIYKHFEVLKFLISFSSPSIIDCQLLLNQACKSGDIKNITWLLDNFDPDIFEVCSAIHHAFDKCLSTDHKRRCEDITMLLLNRCQCTLSDIQAVMETVCSKGMVTLMKCLVLIFGPDSFDFRRILDIAISPINTEILPLAFCQCRNSQIDLQNIIIRACKTGGNETLMVYIFFTVMVGLDQKLVVDTIHTILDIRCLHSTDFLCMSSMHSKDITNEVIKFLFTKVDSKTVDFTLILKKIYMSGRNALVLWIMKNIHHSLIDIQETLHEICRKGDIDSMKYLLHTCKYGNLVNESCIHNAFSSGSFEMVNMLITDFPHITFDTKVAMNNASSSGVFAVVQWLFYKYSLCPNRFSFLEPFLDLKLARSVFDLNSSMLNACRNGHTDVVQWLLQLYSYETFDMRLSLIEASASGQTYLVKWMLAVYDNDIFDIESSLISACKNGKLQVVQLFIVKFGIDAFHMETITTEACKSGNKKLVKWLHEPVSCELFEILFGMHN